MHIIAYTYHWSEYELRNMPVRRRREWLRMIDMQKREENKAFDKDNPEYQQDGLSKYKESY